MNLPSILRKLPALAALAVVVAIAGGLGEAHAQLSAMGPPINTTLVVRKPAPGQLYGNQQVIKLGVGSQVFRFVLVNAYVDDPSGRVFWNDIWQQVRQYKPNLVVQGENADTFANIKPGETLTIKGMYAPLNHTYEVVYVSPGAPFQKGQHY